MDLIRPFRALRVSPRHAARVCAVPYDVVDTREARALAADNPDSFLHVSKPEIDFPDGTDPHDGAVYAAGRKALDRLREAGRLELDAEPRLYVYRVEMGEHTQTGVVAAASVEAYRADRIKRHEHVNPVKVEDRAQNAHALDAHTGTLFLTYRADEALDARVASVAAREPDIDVTAEDGIRHAVWEVADSQDIAEITDAFNAMDAVYIADGHHRSAAADRLQSLRADARAAGEDVAAADWFLSVLFPDDQVQILPYNRVISSLNGLEPTEILGRLADAFEVEPSPDPVAPEGPREFGMYLAGAWYRLQVRDDRVPDDPVGRLDINLLSDNCIAPLLGIEDQRTDPRIDFVGGVRGTKELERRVDSGEMKIAFSFFRTGLDDVLAVADAGEVMPTKSTWFEPKLRDGLLVLPLDAN